MWNRTTDFAPGQLPAGPKGDKGDPGPMGPSGPGARVRTTTLQTFASGSTTAVRFNEVEFDTEGAFDDASDRLVAPRAGVYVINAMHTWVSGPASGVRTAWIEVNGTARAMTRDAATTQTVAQNVTTVERLQQGDRVSLAAYQNTGDSLTTVGVNGIGRAYLAFQWVAP